MSSSMLLDSDAAEARLRPARRPFSGERRAGPSFLAAFGRAGAAACAALALLLMQPADAVAQPTPSSGKIAWYGGKFAGRTTASGERFDPRAMTMAHRTLPFGTRVKVTNQRNGRSVILRVNDRGPTQPDRIGDVSRAAAERLGMLKSGVVEATIEPQPRAAARRR